MCVSHTKLCCGTHSIYEIKQCSNTYRNVHVFAGLLFEISGSYENAFLVAGGVMAMGTCTLSLIPLFMTSHVPELIKINGSSHANSTDAIVYLENKVDKSTATKRNLSNQSLVIYDCKRLSGMSWTSTWTISDYALGRLGNVFGLESIIESMDRESSV